jgi:hypothetical protein
MVAVLILLAVVLAVVVAPWAPERAEAAAELFSRAEAAPTASGAGQAVRTRGEMGSGAHIAGSPVFNSLARATTTG